MKKVDKVTLVGIKHDLAISISIWEYRYIV